jgi:signal transduction histidine kinase
MGAGASRAKYREALATLSHSRWPVAAGVALALTVLAASICLSLFDLRRRIFVQIANRDGETLDAVAAMQYADDKANDESITTLSDPGEQLQLALKISTRLRNVLGVRLFSPEGRFVSAVPAYITETSLPAGDLEWLQRARPISHYVSRARLEEQDLLAETNSAPLPLLEVNIPLREEGSDRLEGIAQFLMNGSSIAAEYAQLNKHLAAQGALAFVISGAIVATGLMLAFRRVARANTLLEERTRSLLKANRELALAAKASAIGAVTSHLIHGLRNPLSGLRSFVQHRAGVQDQGQQDDGDWQLAVASTQRMQTLIDRVVRVLQEQQTVAEYELSFAEMLEILFARIQPVAHAANVKYTTVLDCTGSVSNREADLILLILENLLHNAVEATPAGKEVRLHIFSDPETSLVMEVQDQGPGLSRESAGRLFTPCNSSKKGGSGIGLAISRQLAAHLGALLELTASSSNGCCFRLVLPAHVSAPTAKACVVAAPLTALPIGSDARLKTEPPGRV